MTILRRVPTLTLRHSRMMLSHLLDMNLGFFARGENWSGGWFPNYKIKERRELMWLQGRSRWASSFSPSSLLQEETQEGKNKKRRSRVRFPPDPSSGLSVVSWSSCWRPQRTPCSPLGLDLQRSSLPPPPGLRRAPARSGRSQRAEGRRCPVCWRCPCWRCQPPPRHRWTGRL